MAVTASALLTRLLQGASCHRASPPSSKFPAAETSSCSLLRKIRAYLASGDLRRAVALLPTAPFALPKPVYARLLQLCAYMGGALVEVRKIESHLITFNPSPITFLLNRTIEAYAKCGSLADARELFNEMPLRDGGTWNAMIVAYAQAGHAAEAVSLFLSMNGAGVYATEVTLASVLSSCGDVLDLFLARQIHGLVLKCGFCFNVILMSALVDVYGKCRVIGEASKMFDEIEDPNPVSWNVIVRRYLDIGNDREALFLFFRMLRENFRPLNFTFSNALIACCNIMAHEEGRQIHGITVKTAFEVDDVVSTSLIEMYAKCGLLDDACQVIEHYGPINVVTQTSLLSGYARHGRLDEAEVVFHGMRERNTISWNAMLAAYIQSLSWERALIFTRWLLRETKDIDQVTVGLILNVCSGLHDLQSGKQVHGSAYRHGLHTSHVVRNAIIDMYGKCGNLRTAELMFSQMSNSRDIISWNSLLASYIHHVRSEEALSILVKMQKEVTPNRFTLSIGLAACSNVLSLKHGKQMHGYIIRNQHESDIVIKGALVDMYSKCRLLRYALKVFEDGPRDTVLWNSMLLGCAYSGMGREVLDGFDSMTKDGILPDNVTFLAVLLACINEGRVDMGCLYFDVMSEQYCVIPRTEHYECMIELFCVRGDMDGLEEFVSTMPFQPTIPMWTRIFYSSCVHGNSKLGEWAARCINESNPLNVVQFEFPSNLCKLKSTLDTGNRK